MLAESRSSSACLSAVRRSTDGSHARRTEGQRLTTLYCSARFAPSPAGARNGLYLSSSGRRDTRFARVSNAGTLADIQARTYWRCQDGSTAEFAPIVDAECRVLVLGTMPGTVSLQRNQYYAHERNRFWRVMESLVGVPANAPYEDRLVGLRSAGIALWDTLKHCERGGSLDAKIRNAEPNDFGGFLEQYPSICVIALNGRKAAEVFRRRIYPGLPVKLVAWRFWSYPRQVRRMHAEGLRLCWRTGGAWRIGSVSRALERRLT